jgi:ribosomal 50S subunit-recycling heat shock protein
LWLFSKFRSAFGFDNLINPWYTSGMRIDKFLKVSRILKRRTVANDACGQERVFVNGRAVKPSYPVKVGDAVRIEFGARTLSFRILAIAEKAGKEEAASLYELTGSDT